MRHVAIAVLVILLGFGIVRSQDGQPVNLSDGPAVIAYSSVTAYTASGLTEYVGQARTARSDGTMATFAVTCGGTQRCITLTSIVDSSNTATVTTASAHGLPNISVNSVGYKITISGATVDSDLNGTYFVQTIPSTTTFTITTASVTDDTYTESTLKYTTTGPLTTDAVWSIRRYLYNSSSQLVGTMWAVNCSAEGAVGSTGMVHIWDNRATTTGANKTCYQ